MMTVSLFEAKIPNPALHLLREKLDGDGWLKESLGYGSGSIERVYYAVMVIDRVPGAWCIPPTQ